MRIYNPDGTFQENPLDAEFGWYLEDIAIDESLPGSEEHNLRMKEMSKAQIGSVTQNTSVSDSTESSLEQSETFTLPPTPKLTLPKITPLVNSKTTTSQNVDLKEQLQLEDNLTKFIGQLDKFRVPSKEELMNLINPVNIEARALLSVVSSAKCSSLSDKETSEDILRTINFRTTNSKHLIHEESVTEPLSQAPILDSTVPKFNFLLNGESTVGDKAPKFNILVNGESVDIDKELYSEIQDYHATKEDNMLSLMMELIITDLDSNVGDMSEVNHSINGLSNADACAETSDLGNSPQTSVSSRESDGGGGKDRKESNYLMPVRYLEPGKRADILLSIGLSDDIDKSIQSFREEKSEMHLQLSEIRESFKQDDAKITKLINDAISLEKDLRETAYLDKVVHLLRGNPEKVIHSKWPFAIFRRSSTSKDDDNFIV